MLTRPSPRRPPPRAPAPGGARLHTPHARRGPAPPRAEPPKPTPVCGLRFSGNPTHPPSLRQSQTNDTTLQPTQAANLLTSASDELAAGNRATALRLFEQAARAASSRPEAAAAAWGAAVVHTSFGDIEPAQAQLRAASDAGLDLAAALAGTDSTPGVIPFRGAPQITTQLKRFAADLARAKKAAAAAPPPSVPPPSTSAASPVPADLSAGIDGSVPAIIKRVVLLLLALVGLGVGLWAYGLKYLELGAIGGF